MTSAMLPTVFSANPNSSTDGDVDNSKWEEFEYVSAIETNSRSTSDTRRPIWNVAHMVNSLWEVDYYLNQGANSLEFDVSFDNNGNPEKTYHGIPCDCFRYCTRSEKIDRYIEYLRLITTPGTPIFRKELVLLFMDLKIKGLTEKALQNAGESMATKLMDIYWEKGLSGAQAYVLISVPSVNRVAFVKSFKKRIDEKKYLICKDKIGFDFSGNEEIDAIEAAAKNAELGPNMWLGDGITNCLPRSLTRLVEAINRRNEAKSDFQKIYWWTVDKMASMRRTLSLGVDGMITNNPASLIEVLNESGYFENFRLATIEDSPWKKHSLKTGRLTLLPKFDDFDFNHNGVEILYNI